jgi:mannosyltransferase
MDCPPGGRLADVGAGKAMDRVRARRWALVLLGMLTLTGALLRAWQIGDKSLWIDEAFSVWIARQPLAEGISWLARIDQHPPLYYALLHLWLRLGDGPAAVRLFSALVSVLNVPVLYGLGARLAGRKVGLLAAAVLALSPFHVYLAQEARMYTLLSLTVSLSLWALARLLSGARPAATLVSRCEVGIARTERPTAGRKEHPPRLAMTDQGLPAQETRLAMTVSGRAASRRWRAGWRLLRLCMAGGGVAWAGYVLATGAALWTHNTAVLYWVAANAIVLGLWLTGRRRRTGVSTLAAPPLGKWALAQGAALLLWAPWLRSFVRQSAAVYEHFWLAAPTWRTVLRTVGDFLCAFLPRRIGWTTAIWAGYGALLALGLWALRRRRGWLWFLVAAFTVAVGGAWLISLVRPIFYDRTLIWATVALYLLLAAGIAELRYRSFVVTAMAMLATLSLLSLRDYYSGYQKEAWDEAAAYVAAHAEEGDLVLFHATWTQLPFDYYFHDYGVPVEERGAPVDLFARGVLEPRMRTEDVPVLRALVHGRERAWLVYSHQWYTDPQGLVPKALGETLALQGRRRFYGLEVRLYAAR